jgi:integrase
VWTEGRSLEDGKQSKGKRNELGLGSYPAVSLAKARKLAAECREAIAAGENPIAARRREQEPTFRECADKFLASMESQWRNEKHRAQWRMTLAEYAKPLASKRVSAIGTDDVLGVLNPIWQKRPETASRLRGRIERVLDFAKARGWRTGENPALWRGHLKNILPARQRLTRGHHAAMAYQDVPAFFQSLANREALAARALEFLILTAARSGEVLGATWNEFDLDAALWTVSGRRMKAGREHRVPLSKPALAIVKALHEARTSDYVFPGYVKDKPLSNMAFAMLMKRAGVAEYTAHGFRSAFRDWAGDATSFPRDVAEQALAHRVGDATELAYRRSDAIEKRRMLMAAWAEYCTAIKGANVIPMARA